MNEGLAMVDEKGYFTYINHRFSEIVDRNSDELINHHISEYLEEASQDLWKKEFAARKRGEHDPYEVEWVTKAGDGGKHTNYSMDTHTHKHWCGTPY